MKLDVGKTYTLTDDKSYQDLIEEIIQDYLKWLSSQPKESPPRVMSRSLNESKEIKEVNPVFKNISLQEIIKENKQLIEVKRMLEDYYEFLYQKMINKIYEGENE